MVVLFCSDAVVVTVDGSLFAAAAAAAAANAADCAKFGMPTT